MNNYEQLKAYCLESNPDIETMACKCPKGGRYEDGGVCHLCDGVEYVHREIRLADVLFSILYKHRSRSMRSGQVINKDGWDNFKKDAIELLKQWNLIHDSLEWHKENAPEVLTWLVALLETEKYHGKA